jgi:hypothetical protein
MKFFLDTTKKQLVKSAASNVALDRLVLKRRDSLAVEVAFVARGAVASMPAGTTTTVALKKTFADSNFLALASGEPPTLNLNTVPLEAAFSANPASISALLEIRWSVPGETTRTATLSVEIQNSVILGTEATPEAIPDGKATQAEATTGTDNTKWMTPLRTAQAIAQLAPPPTWASVLDKPATFPATAHTHLKSEITGLNADLAALTSADTALGQRIDFLAANLDPAALDSIAEAAASIGSLQTQINGKAATLHTHTAADITDFASAVVAVSPPVDWSSLTGKPATFAPSAHTHPATSITGLSDYIVASAPGLSITTTTHTADGLTDTYSVGGLASSDPSAVLVSLNGVTQNPATDYTVNLASGTIIFDGYPAAGQQIVFTALGLRSVQPPLDPTLYLYAFDQSANGLTTYSGRLLNADRPAAPALPETATSWTIKRSTLSAAGRVLANATATGSWLNRETLAFA